MNRRRLLIVCSLLLILFLVVAMWPRHSKATIVIDAGHGGLDPGTTSILGTYEKEIALQLALAIGDALTNAHYDVVFTRTTDETISLDERVRRMNASGATLALSIHGNAIERRDDISGVQLLYYPDTSSENEHRATIFMQTLLHEIDGIDRGTIARPELAVLRGTTMPSFLIEAGFLTNRDDATRLERKETQLQFAEAVVRAVDQLLPSLLNGREENER